MSDTPICPCDIFIHPSVIFNPPGRSVIAYRVGDYITFRHALLLALPGETELVNWRPTAQGDLALQMMEWWAYLADILTFYNEYIANQSYLGTADLPESIRRLIRLLGYRPRPGIGASAVVAALVSGTTPFTLPAGFQIQSKPGPGKEPQIFELDQQTQVGLPDGVAFDPPATVSLPQMDSRGNATTLLRGVVTTVKAGDEVLLLKTGWLGVDGSGNADLNYALATVAQVQQEKDPRGTLNTRVTFTGTLSLPGDAQVGGYRLLKSTQSAHVWPYSAKNVIQAKQVDLEAITRQVNVGDPVLFESLIGTPGPALVSVTNYTEVIWNANTGDLSDPTQPPKTTAPPTPPIPIPHTRLQFQPSLAGSWDTGTVLLRFAWQVVGELIASPATAFSGTPTTVTAVSPAAFPPGDDVPLLLEDGQGNGALATGTVEANPAALQLITLPTPPVALTPPLKALFNLLNVSRGKTVPTETLGSGDASIPGQEFVLRKSPVTYLPGDDATSGDGFQSTVRIWVYEVEWKEVPSFYGQRADAHIFVTREDESNKTHVLFGDGINGARLPSGVNNVVASYRYGSGADAPAPGTLTVVVQPQPHLQAIRNPVAAGGGADPDPPAKIRRYAPQSVLTFGRAVSGDDYETIAAEAPGVARARAYWAWDAGEQRTLVTVYVGDDASAVSSASTALARAADPNRPVQVKQAFPRFLSLSLSLLMDPTYLAERVTPAVRAALLDEDTGLLSARVARIGQPVYDSQIFAACLSVPGVLAVHALQFIRSFGNQLLIEPGERHDPGEGGFYQLSAASLTLSVEVAAYAR
ncbi:MAG TPA: hypothetical protein VFU32_13985 [Ktedonobacterales bacterium]|nr:hypothetical protein [Ktedonobacterales bacterium]